MEINGFSKLSNFQFVSDLAKWNGANYAVMDHRIEVSAFDDKEI